MHPIFGRIAKHYPSLKLKLRIAGMKEKPEEFVRKTILTSLYMTSGLCFAVFLLVSKYKSPGIGFILAVPLIFVVMYLYLSRIPDFKISKAEKEVSKEILFAGRFIIIELESGVPLYNAMINVSKNYPGVGKYFREIINKIDLGTNMEEALNEASETVPSDDLRKILWQIVNSIRTGSNVAKSLYSVMNQITKDQITEVNKYGKTLNPLAMFYMIVAVILPSLGMTMLIIFSSFVKLELSLTVLIILAFTLGFMQFMFISIVKILRPSIEF